MARLNTSAPLLPEHAVRIDDWFVLVLAWRTDRCERYHVTIGSTKLTVHVYEDGRVDVVSAENTGARCATFWPRDFVAKTKDAKLVTLAESRRERRAPKRSK